MWIAVAQEALIWLYSSLFPSHSIHQDDTSHTITWVSGTATYRCSVASGTNAPLPDATGLPVSVNPSGCANAGSLRRSNRVNHSNYVPTPRISRQNLAQTAKMNAPLVLADNINEV